MQYGAAESQPLLPANRQRARGVLPTSFEPRHFQRPFEARRNFFFRHAIHAGEELQIFGNPEVVVERELLRHIPDVLAHSLGIPGNVNSGNRRASGRRPQQPAEDADRCRFAGTIRAEESENLAVARLEAHIVHRNEIPESLREILNHNRWPILVHQDLAGDRAADSFSTADTKMSSMLASTCWIES